MSSWSLTLGDEGEAAWPGICQAFAEAKDARGAARIAGRRTRLAKGRLRSQAVSRRDAPPRASSAAGAASFATSASPPAASAAAASASGASASVASPSSESREVQTIIEHAHPTPPIIKFHDLTLVRAAVHGPPLPPAARQQRVLVDRIYRCSAKEAAALEKKVAARIEEYEDHFDEDSDEEFQYGGPLYEREEHIASLKVALVYADKHHPDLDRTVLKKILLRKVPSSVAHPEWVEEIQDFLDEIFPYPDTFARTNARPAAAEIIHNTLEGDDPDYLAFVNTPRKLYCIRCKLYACNLHQEDGDTLRKGSLQLQYEVAMETEKRRGKPVLETRQYDALEIPARSELEPWQKAICRRVFLIYEGDLDKVALVVNAPRSLIEDFCRDFKVPSERVLVKNPPKDKHPYQSLKNYPHNLYKAIREKGVRAYCQPCAHDRPCEEKDSGCSCVKNTIFCGKECAWGALSRNFFRGCNCKGDCENHQCTCRAMKRECDPKLCVCDTCTDPPGQLITKQRCCNDNATMRRKRPTLVGPSERFGWGLFSRYKIPKGGFVVEYYGEMISHEEADRRGYLYDLVGNSSLFDLSTDFVVDAERVCNEARFINHAAKKYANLQPEHLTVNGDRRMLFFANQDIPAQTELTFDYNDGNESEKTFKAALKDGGPPEDSRKRKNSKGKKRGGAHKMLKKPPS